MALGAAAVRAVCERSGPANAIALADLGIAAVAPTCRGADASIKNAEGKIAEEVADMNDQVGCGGGAGAWASQSLAQTRIACHWEALGWVGAPLGRPAGLPS